MLSHAACKHDFRGHFRSHSWGVIYQYGKFYRILQLCKLPIRTKFDAIGTTVGTAEVSAPEQPPTRSPGEQHPSPAGRPQRWTWTFQNAVSLYRFKMSFQDTVSLYRFNVMSIDSRVNDTRLSKLILGEVQSSSNEEVSQKLQYSRCLRYGPRFRFADHD